jgi:hypothetical protein
MVELHLEKLSPLERRKLAVLRAEAWAKGLTVVQFCQRNERLYEHSFGKTRIDTWGLKNSQGEIVSSLDALRVRFFFKESPINPVVERDGFLIASVITPDKFRNQGYASLLIEKFLSQETLKIGVLYSDIGPKFYEKFGFQKTAVQLRAMNCSFLKGSSYQCYPIEFENLVDRAYHWRKKRFELNPNAQLILVPDGEFWDWQWERFRFFAEMKGYGKMKPTTFAHETQQGLEYFWVVPNFLTGVGEVLWAQSQSLDSLAAIGSVVFSWGLGSLNYWGLGNGERVLGEECPMGWIRTNPVNPQPQRFFGEFSDPQLCDWW